MIIRNKRRKFHLPIFQSIFVKFFKLDRSTKLEGSTNFTLNTFKAPNFFLTQLCRTNFKFSAKKISFSLCEILHGSNPPISPTFSSVKHEKSFRSKQTTFHSHKFHFSINLKLKFLTKIFLISHFQVAHVVPTITMEYQNFPNQFRMYLLL